MPLKWSFISQLEGRKDQSDRKHTLSGDDYQFLQKSVIPTYHFQKSLRRLPIPKLTDSCNRFLASAKVVLSEADYKRTEEVVRSFEKTEGPELQKALLDYDRNHKDTSYICEPWFDMYLKSRLPLPVNYNPFMMYAPDPNTRFNHQLSRATNFAVSFARFKRALEKNILAPEVFHLNPKKSDTKLFRNVCKTLPPTLSWFGAVAFKAFPLDMSQYKSTFNGTRIPKKGKDVLHQDETQKHFMVLYRGKIYAVDIFDDKGEILPAEDVHNSLAYILETGARQEADKCVGALTSLNRDEWASAREELLEAGNAEKLRSIDGALFTLCLDDLKSQDPTRLVQSLLIGDDASNRWFDKSFQLIMDGNGQATINFEHSWGDGVAVLRLMEESYKDTNLHHFVTPDTKTKTANKAMVREIEMNLTPSLRSKIENAKKVHLESNSMLDFATVEYAGLNKNAIKKSKLSPDSIMQLGIQMAFYSLYGDFVPTYESCSTAAFLKGRTECMRSATAATREATLALLSGKSVKAPELLLQCSNTHTQLVKEASMGQGFDRHLLGLKITAERLGKPMPALFEDPGFNRMSHFVLSTSTLSTNTIVFGGFGPVVEDGLGIGYNVSSTQVGAVITSHKKNRDAKDFAKALEKSLDTLKNIRSLHEFTPLNMGEHGDNRPDMVEAAKKFMLTPKVRDTPFEEQRQFLLGKGVTEAEIAEARASIPARDLNTSSAVHYDVYQPPQQSRLASFAQSVAVIGCVSYAGYRFLRSFVLPRFFDIPDPATEEVRQLQGQVNELQNSIKFVLDSVSQTTSMLAAQQQEISKALLSVSQRDTDISKVETGISTIKSLLLSHNNFAPILAPTATSAKLPSWQQAESSLSAPATTSGYTTPPANFRETLDEPESDEVLDHDQV
ncbi:unnamed protein product [Cylicocyclus nassatus]|uniref:Choline/carnitine acyltransferase domain-containing protein n=1 Tax=Cylicocyclus nassatus TaxID=53992 RepID=A0AA36H3G9_CYLNA|nr:unnamed protein product [Cylicocyclus nassatus]